MLEIFGRGVLMGVAIAAPVGPIGVLCIRHTLSKGRFTGLVAGLGAATADGIYGCVAGLGLSAIADVLTNYQQLLGISGGLFLCYLGTKNLLSQATTLPKKTILPKKIINGGGQDHDVGDLHQPVQTFTFLLKTYLETLLLTLANPATILSFTAIFVGLGDANEAGKHSGALALVAGVFMGSALWWLILSSGVGVVRDRLLSIPIIWINRSSGAVITIFGLIAIFAKT
ncbi:MAG: LysE family transporter [Cyanothece sp. SIO2G6]|nr:LysE family transporter [Cyanothece sp. SIO2G6]